MGPWTPALPWFLRYDHPRGAVQEVTTHCPVDGPGNNYGHPYHYRGSSHISRSKA